MEGPGDDSPNRVFVVVPNWDRNTVVPVGTEGVDPEIRERFIAGERLFARANLGALTVEDLFFTDWET